MISLSKLPFRAPTHTETAIFPPRVSLQPYSQALHRSIDLHNSLSRLGRKFMKKKLIILTMLLATVFFWIPAENSVTAQDRHGRRSVNHGSNDRHSVWQQGKHKGNWRKKNSYGYKNYGQYRRTQVGNRRYRMVRRYSLIDGVRRLRWTRLYY